VRGQHPNCHKDLKNMLCAQGLQAANLGKKYVVRPAEKYVKNAE